MMTFKYAKSSVRLSAQCTLAIYGRGRRETPLSALVSKETTVTVVPATTWLGHSPASPLSVSVFRNVICHELDCHSFLENSVTTFVCRSPCHQPCHPSSHHLSHYLFNYARDFNLSFWCVSRRPVLACGSFMVLMTTLMWILEKQFFSDIDKCWKYLSTIKIFLSLVSRLLDQRKERG